MKTVKLYHYGDHYYPVNEDDQTIFSHIMAGINEDNLKTITLLLEIHGYKVKLVNQL